MNLSLANRRFVPGLDIDFKDPVARKKPWLTPGLFSEEDAGQLREMVEQYQGSGKDLTDAALLSGGYDTFGEIAEVPLECWDVVDETGQVRYQLWVYCGESGALFNAGTNEAVGQICQGGFESEDDSIGPALERALEGIKEAHPDAEVLQGFSFVD